jgi:nitroreductase
MADGVGARRRAAGDRDERDAPLADFFDVVERRRSVRAFRPADIDAATLERVLETADRAPSAGDLQAYEIVIVREPERKAALAQAAYEQSFVASAPVVLVFCANPGRSSPRYGRRGGELYCVQDATIAAAYAQLAAAALGLASVWVGAFDEAAVAGIVGGLKPVCIMPIGRPAEEPAPTPRRSLDDLVHAERLAASRASRHGADLGRSRDRGG